MDDKKIKQSEAQENFSKSVGTFIELSFNAFDEFHAAVLEKIEIPAQYIPNHHDYPYCSMSDSGFPLFFETGFYDKNGPKYYTQTLRGTGIISMLMLDRDNNKFPECDKLYEFLQGDALGQGFKSDHDDEVSRYEVEALISSTVESYFQRFGTGPLDEEKRRDAMKKMLWGSILGSFQLRIVIPITLTHFDVDHYRLTESSYIARIPKGIQLSRARMDMRGSGAVKNVVGAATHAFISTDWSIEVNSRHKVRQSLNNPAKNVLDEADLFFAALRGATGAKTGYAQVIMMPTDGVVDVFCDLPTTYGATYRRYPAEFDEYGWAYGGQSRVTAEQMADVKRLYTLILARPEERVRIALMRLNTCMSRDDAVDAVLDATIALEVLLGDKENMAIAYKIRMRAGALAAFRGDRLSTEVAAAVNKIYATRSKIVHGLTTSKSKKRVVPEEDRYVIERDAAVDILRYIIEILLENPRFLEPGKIDQELLLGVAPLP